jgi:hypothetical protein
MTDVNPLRTKLQRIIAKSNKVFSQKVKFISSFKRNFSFKRNYFFLQEKAAEAEQAPSTANNDWKLNDERWVYWGETLSPELFSKTSARLGATLNEVVVTAIARGLRRYMVDLSLQAGELPASSGEQNLTQQNKYQ